MTCNSEMVAGLGQGYEGKAGEAVGRSAHKPIAKTNETPKSDSTMAEHIAQRPWAEEDESAALK